ncbi:MAG: hypothetical protein JWP28_2873 [Phenylobacterium sp.]|uniref:hypothetical protein n=1 Tax=Phenylobacterium sp. TaxID=1871053 RepID=UPI00261D89D2|nr:hypothetical protein [Phenylobacterium sp.]MDB5498842.1 hypothetical protein [Phenylobacterium sp.]
MDDSDTNTAEQRQFVRAIRLDPDLDRPLYRIFPLWSFEDMLRVGRLVLVPPSFWEDPLEDIPSSIMMQGPNHRQKSLVEYLNTAFAQCWSFESESDSLLRAYSRVSIDKLHNRNTEPRYEGVQVRTTPRKLIHALLPWAESVDWGQLYLGRVEYLSHDEASQKIGNVLARVGPYEIARGDNRAQSLLLKRKAFSHEDEVRVIFICNDRRQLREPLTINIEPNDFIDEVRFDPRLIIFERREREETAKSLGYSGAFAESLLYQKTFFQTILPWNWADWDLPETEEDSGGQP